MTKYKCLYDSKDYVYLSAGKLYFVGTSVMQVSMIDFLDVFQEFLDKSFLAPGDKVEERVADMDVGLELKWTTNNQVRVTAFLIDDERENIQIMLALETLHEILREYSTWEYEAYE